MSLRHTAHAWMFFPNLNMEYHFLSMLTNPIDLAAGCGCTDGCFLLSSGTKLAGRPFSWPGLPLVPSLQSQIYKYGMWSHQRLFKTKETQLLKT